MMKDFTDKIWYTYKARIRSSERLNFNNAHSQYLLVWYALVTAALSIITIRYPETLGPNTDISSAIMSVALLVISLLVANVDYRGRAIGMRKNYLELQYLYDTILSHTSLESPTAEMLKKYNDLLSDCENHLSVDDKYWRVMLPKHAALKLTRPPSTREIFDTYTYIVIRVTLLFLLYALPILSAFLLVTYK